MKYLNIVLGVLMSLFIVVQYNDPDGWLWCLIYAVPLIWAGLAAFRLQQMTSQGGVAALGVSVALMAVLTVYYWPQTEGFWHSEVWWNTETAREGMGMMIAMAVTLVAAGTIWSARRKA